MNAIDGKILATKSDCYKSARKMTPKGIVVHSTGCSNPNIRRYVAPDDGVIGANPNRNSMNEPGQDVCVHAIIGKDKNGKVKCYQILPFDYCCWGVGSGSKGSYNYNPAYIQFEMCEDGLTDKTYCKAVYDKAVEFCAYICKTYNLSTDNIVSHHEAGQKGMGSSHIDPDNWWGRHGYTMDKFRVAVKSKLGGTATTKTAATNLYRVRRTWSDINSQTGAYSSLENAKKACKAGYTVYDKNGKAVYTKAADSAIKVSSKVRVKSGAKDYSGNGLAAFVYKTTYTVMEISGNRAVIGVNGAVTAAVHINNLIKV